VLHIPVNVTFYMTTTFLWEHCIKTWTIVRPALNINHDTVCTWYSYSHFNCGLSVIYLQNKWMNEWMNNWSTYFIYPPKIFCIYISTRKYSNTRHTRQETLASRWTVISPCQRMSAPWVDQRIVSCASFVQ